MRVSCGNALPCFVFLDYWQIQQVSCKCKKFIAVQHHHTETTRTKFVCAWNYYMLYLIMKKERKKEVTCILPAPANFDFQCHISVLYLFHVQAMQRCGFVFQRWAAVFKYCVFDCVLRHRGPTASHFRLEGAPVRPRISPASLILGALLGWREEGGGPAQLWLRWPLVSFVGCQWLRGVEGFRCWSACAKVPARVMYMYRQPSFLLHGTRFFLPSSFASCPFPGCGDC